MTPAMGSERDGRPQSLAIAVGGALIAAVCVVAVNAPVLGRSVWADEAMLFSNYPLASIGHALRPLPFYDRHTVSPCRGSPTPVFRSRAAPRSA